MSPRQDRDSDREIGIRIGKKGIRIGKNEKLDMDGKLGGTNLGNRIQVVQKMGNEIQC